MQYIIYDIRKVKKMNMDFEAALKYIDLGSYDKAIEKLNSAIEKESANEETAIQYRCVLGELQANLGHIPEARAEFEKVQAYCLDTHTLEKQGAIAQTYLDVFDGKIKPPAEQKRPGFVPLIPKPTQDRGFINKQMRKHK